MQKIPFGIRMPNKPFCPFAQMDKVQAAKKPEQKGVWGCAPMGNMR
jgi:hypothetical protein